jgi:hypothetical protein
VPPILPPKDGYLFLDRTKFAASFAADVEADTWHRSWPIPKSPGELMPSRAPLQNRLGEPSRAYYLVATEDKMIPPPAQRAMAGRAKAQVTEVPGSHAIYVSKSAEVAEFIQRAADDSI